jgi:hypothetical protein
VTVAELRLRKNRSGERGPGKLERGRAHRRVSRAANGEAELTKAKDGRERDGDRRTGSG